MLPLCEKEGIGVMSWSPLARGYLARPAEDIDATARGETGEELYEHPYRDGGGREINERVEEIAEEKGDNGTNLVDLAITQRLGRRADNRNNEH